MIIRSSFLILLLTTFLVVPASASGSAKLTGHVPIGAAGIQPVGRLGASDPLELTIGLPLRNQSRLNELLKELYNPSSTNFHRYLSPKEFTDAFGPSDEDYAAVVQFANSRGLTVTGTHSNRMLLNVRAPVQNVEQALHIQLCVYPHPAEARRFYAPDSEPLLDSGLHVLHISGLDNYQLPRSRIRKVDFGRQGRPHAGSGLDGSFLGNDFRKAYVPGTSLTGASQVVGLVALDGYFSSDITDYADLAGLAHVPLQNVLIDGFNGRAHDLNEEVALDIEMAMSMAPGLSKILVYEATPASTTANIDDLLNRMATDNLARQLSCSWAFDIDVTTQQIFKEYAAQGQSFFMASGDEGAYAVAVAQPSDAPDFTVVGGTTLATDSSGAWYSETAWSSGGGGISTVYPIPEWQQGIDMSFNHGSTTMRNVPDVAMVADDVFIMADLGQPSLVSGTSISAPLWAGFTALINEQAAAQGQAPVGFLNPALYALGRGTNSAAVFHDIVLGNNVTTNSPDKFFAIVGYDLCTGWGTPAGTNLINALLSLVPQNLVVTPPIAFVASGPIGGPFNVTSQSYTLTNSGTAPINWSVTKTASWLDIVPTSGTLVPGGPSTTVNVSLNSEADGLLLGEFSDTIPFADLSNGIHQNRPFRLVVGNGGFETGDFSNWTFSAQEEVNFVDSVDWSILLGESTIPGIDDSQFVHSGIYGAFLGQNTSPGSMWQELPTIPGQEYTVSFWLDNPALGTPNQFQASWNGTVLFDQSNLTSFSWTNLHYVVTATGTNAVLKFLFENDQNAFGLDEVVVVASGPQHLATLTLMAAPAGGGTVSGGGDYLIGSQHKIGASAADGWTFVGWNDGNQDNPRTVIVPADGATYTANFVPKMVELTVLINPEEGGLVSGNGTYLAGSQQQIAAVALPGWTFTGWSDGNQDNPRTVTLPANGATYTAEFAASAVLTVQANPAGGGSVAGSGTFPVGSTQQISATPANGWAFASWNDGNQDNPRSAIVPINGATYTANFLSTSATLTVQANPAEGGSVAGSGAFPPGSTQQISASPANGWAFASWSDGNQDNPRTVIVPISGATYTANFLSTLAALTLQANPTAGGSVAGSGTFPAGSMQQISASPANGWAFAGWSDGNQDNPRNVIVPANGATYTASFVLTAQLAVQANPVTGGSVTGTGTFPVGSTQQISATATNGWAFTGWDDGNQENPRTITVTTNGATYTASFVLTAQLTVQANPATGGSVAGAGTFPVGSTQQISATATNGWAFTGWDDGNQEDPRTITVTTNGATYTAGFVLTAQLTVQANPVTGGSVAGAGTFPVGSTQQISATATNGWAFTGWNDGIQDNPRTVTVTTNGVTYTALFHAAIQPPNLVVSFSSAILTLNITGTPSDGYALEASDDLQTWADLQTITISDSGSALVTLSLPSAQQTFFRVVHRP